MVQVVQSKRPQPRPDVAWQVLRAQGEVAIMIQDLGRCDTRSRVIVTRGGTGGWMERVRVTSDLSRPGMDAMSKRAMAAVLPGTLRYPIGDKGAANAACMRGIAAAMLSRPG